MCLIVFAWRPGHTQPLIVAANRDEFYARPSAALAEWADHPGVYAGRDLEAGGSWLGIGPGGRFAALTNIRDPGQPAGVRSRGDLVAGFLCGKQSLDEYFEDVGLRSAQYAGFNLLLGDGQRLGYVSSSSPLPEFLGEGVYGLSNAGLNTPWPKLLKARQALQGNLAAAPRDLLGVLADPAIAPDAELPSTGVGLATERLLSSIFIASPNYGTRASTLVSVAADGSRQLIERSFGPYGAKLGEVEITLGAEPALNASSAN
jgi:uncharacterized protein with NRDE domain